MVSEYKRSVDRIFGRVESFTLVKTHRVQIQIGNSYFIGTRTYPTAEAARLASKRLEAKP
jgi:hypothetical protein